MTSLNELHQPGEPQNQAAQELEPDDQALNAEVQAFHAMQEAVLERALQDAGTDPLLDFSTLTSKEQIRQQLYALRDKARLGLIE